MGVTLSLGHGMKITDIEELKELTDDGPRPGETDGDYAIHLVENWRDYKMGYDELSEIYASYTSSDGSEEPWFPRSRDGMELDARYFLHQKRLSDAQFSYGGYSHFREFLLETVSEALGTSKENIARPSPDVLAQKPTLKDTFDGMGRESSDPTVAIDVSSLREPEFGEKEENFERGNGNFEYPGGEMGRNIAAHPRFCLPRELRPLWRSFNDDDTAFRPESLSDLGLGTEDSALDPYDIVPFADILNFGDDQGVIGAVGVERLNQSMDWLGSRIVKTNDAEVNALQWFMAGGESMRFANENIISFCNGLRAIRNKPGAYIYFS